MIAREAQIRFNKAHEIVTMQPAVLFHRPRLNENLLSRRLARRPSMMRQLAEACLS